MKKNVSSLILLTVILVLMLGFTACEKLKISNLTANHHVKKGNGYYMDEKYRKAIGEYEKAIELNPELDVIYFHLATSYAALYKPNKNTEENKQNGERALEYLRKAQEIQPDNIKIVHALGDLYEKLGNFEEAEKAYLTIMDKAEDNPKGYYVLANFYSNHGQNDKAEEMYVKRINQDPFNPEGYHYMAGYYQGRNLWYKATDNHVLRIAAMIDTNIVNIQREINGYKEQIERIKKKLQYMNNVKRNKAINAETKKEILTTAQSELDEIGTEEQFNLQIEEKEKELADAWVKAEEKIKEFPEEKKLQVSEAYYMLGLVCWNHSYQTGPEYMGPKERGEIIDKGMISLEKSIALNENYWEPWSIVALLHLQKDKVEPLKMEEHKVEWKKAYDKATSIRTRLVRREQLKKQLEGMDEE